MAIRSSPQSSVLLTTSITKVAIRSDDVLPNALTRLTGVVQIGVGIGENVGHPHHLPLERDGATPRLPGEDFPLSLGVLDDAIPDLPREVEAPAVVLEPVHHPQALAVVGESLRGHAVQDRLAGVAEGRVPEVVGHGDGFGERLVEAERLRQRPSDLSHLEGVRQPRPIVVSRRGQKDLGLVGQAAEGFAVDDPIPIPLEAGTDRIERLLADPSPGRRGQTGTGMQGPGLDLLQHLADVEFFPSPGHRLSAIAP
jgi:hypothetical protein